MVNLNSWAKQVGPDQFFTDTKFAFDLSKQVIDFLDNDISKADQGSACATGSSLFVDCCAGQGTFFDLMPWNARMGFEIDSKLCKDDVTCQDFLTVTREQINKGSRKLIFLTNVPFNKQFEFLTKCEDLEADVIAFICSASIARYRPYNLLKNMKIAKSTYYPKVKFYKPNGKSKEFNVYFNIYIKGVPEPVSSFQFMSKQERPWHLVKPQDDYDICFVRWGRVAEVITRDKIPDYKPGLTHTQIRHYFVKFDGCSIKQFTRYLIECLTYANSVRTTNVRSIGIYELFRIWNNFINM